MSAPKKYDHIDFTPTKAMADAAARGLELRKKNRGKGGLSTQQAAKEGVGSGVQRAVNIKNRNKLSPSTVRRMKAFFDRHQKSKEIDPGKTYETDKGYVAFMLWSGSPGYSWARKIVKQMDAADKKAKAALMSEMVKVANDFDTAGLTKEADLIDSLLLDLIEA